MGISSSEVRGLCPNCEKHAGVVGQPCPGESCQERRYHFIPIPWLDAAKAYAARKHRPLDPLLGRRLSERYLLAGKIGEGGMGAVYMAIQEPLGREVAVKLISGVDISPEMLTRFEREARLISALDHPNIVKLYDYGVGDLGYQAPYMAMEYIRRGRTLRKVLAQVREDGGSEGTGPMVSAIFEQILNALGAAHAAGIVHRDMKPENVMITPVHGNPYMVKVLDFGLARTVSPDGLASDNEQVSLPGQILGTLHYMAPEQASHEGSLFEVDGRADLYAVAVMLYEVFCGTRPFEGKNPVEVLAKKLGPSYDPLAAPVAKSLPKPLKEFLAKGLCRDPEGRFQSADEMLHALERALAGRVTTVVGFVIDGIPCGESIPTPEGDAPPISTVQRRPTGQQPVVLDAGKLSALASSLEPLADVDASIAVGMEAEAGRPPARPEAAKPAAEVTGLPESGALAAGGPVKESGVAPGPEVGPGGAPLTGDSGSRSGARPALEVDMPGREASARADVRTGPTGGLAVDMPGLGRVESRARPVEARPKASVKARPRFRRGLESPIVRGLLAFGMAIVLTIPVGLWAFSKARLTRVQSDLDAIRSALSVGGRFVGIGAAPLEPGDNLDYFIREGGLTGAAVPTRDPWGQRYRVKFILDRRMWVVYSTGPDRQPGRCNVSDDDDICADIGQ